MITETQVKAAVQAYFERTAFENCDVVIVNGFRRSLEAAEVAAWLPYDPDTMPQEDVLLYWPAAGVDAEVYSVGVACCGDHVWACDRRDPPTHYRLIVGPK